MIEAEISLTMDEDRSAPLITEVFSPKLTSLVSFNPELDPLPSYVKHCFFFSSRPSRKSDWPVTLETWLICSMQM